MPIRRVFGLRPSTQSRFDQRVHPPSETGRIRLRRDARTSTRVAARWQGGRNGLGPPRSAPAIDEPRRGTHTCGPLRCDAQPHRRAQRPDGWRGYANEFVRRPKPQAPSSSSSSAVAPAASTLRRWAIRVDRADRGRSGSVQALPARPLPAPLESRHAAEYGSFHARVL